MAKSLVDVWRQELDPVASLGVPAHITVLFPFVSSPELDDVVFDRLARIITAVPSFEFALKDVRWFDEDVVWLAPVPAEPFRELTEMVWAEFPDCPPYGGAFADVVPHLTIGDRGPIQRMRQAAATIAPALPVRAVADAVTLMIEQPDRTWVRQAEFPLGRESEGSGTLSR